MHIVLLNRRKTALAVKKFGLGLTSADLLCKVVGETISGEGIMHMGNIEVLEGRVRLPAAELATVKRQYRNRQNALIESAYDALKRFRNKNLTSSVARWTAAIETTDNTASAPPALHIAMKVARSLERPRAVKWEDFSLKYYTKASVTEDTFPLLDEAGDVIGEVTFSGRFMEWKVFEGKHAVADFDDTADAVFLYNTIAQVTWTRGSGGGETVATTVAGAEVRARFGPAGPRYAASL